MGANGPHKRFCAFAALWAALVLAWPPGAAADPPTVEAFFEDFAGRRDAIQTLRADFVQTTVTPDEMVVSEGTLIYAKPKRLIFRYDDPPLVYMIDGLRVYEYDADLEQIQIYQLEDRPESEAFYLGFETDADRLQKAYDVRVLPPDDASKHALGIEFTPKPSDDDSETYFERVVLQLSQGELLPSEILIVNDAESHTSFSVTNFRINEPMSPEMTHVVTPEGTTIVENDEYAGDVGTGGMMFPREAADEPAAVETEDLP